MKRIILVSFIIFGLAFTAAAQNKKKQQDITAIKAMCGCYEVIFEFAETFSPDTTYKFHNNYKTGGLEWVELVEEAPNKLVLQHLLIAEKNSIIKHWRQDWLYENTDLYLFDKENTWKFNQLPTNQVKGQWTQKVYQVDDSPRYEGSATWVHVDGKHYWENTADAPLPRREHTVRSDYNVMKRTNRHEITNYGWLHEQDNDKIVRSNAGDKLIASEKGLNFYKKVNNEKCKAAQTWWKENQSLWLKVRNEWETIFAKKQNLTLAGKVEDKPLFMHFFSLKADASDKEVKTIVEKFVKP